MYALLVIQIQLPASVRGSIGAISVFGVSISVAHLPLSGLLNVSWAFTFLLGLSYCGISVGVERSYAYIHKLETQISEMIGVAHAYSREGADYLSRYPLLLKWVWICYAFALPAILILGTAFLAVVEGTGLPYSWVHRGFDLTLAGMTVVTFALYRVVPWGVGVLRRIVQRAVGSPAPGYPAQPTSPGEQDSSTPEKPHGS